MLAHLEEYRGVGLSANQIGLPYRVFAIRTEPRSVCFNPTITWESDDMTIMEEGCLTYPMLYVKIRRPSVIRAKYFDQNGQIQTNRFSDLIARCYQHELDHLNGVNYLERANKYHLDNAKRKSKLLMRKMKKVKGA
jgi:peptide deformylase